MNLDVAIAITTARSDPFAAHAATKVFEMMLMDSSSSQFKRKR